MEPQNVRERKHRKQNDTQLAARLKPEIPTTVSGSLINEKMGTEPNAKKLCTHTKTTYKADPGEKKWS